MRAVKPFIIIVLLLVSSASFARRKKPAPPSPTPAPTATATPTPAPTATPTPLPPQPKARLETYPDLINKARNLTLQRDRLQTSQVLSHGLVRENKNSVGYREIGRALHELTRVFYTEKAQSLYAFGDSLSELKPKDAIDRYTEALRLEDGNVTVLEALARTELRIGECAAADTNIKQAVLIDPLSADLKLLQAQSLDCQKHYDDLTEFLQTKPADLAEGEKAWTGLVIEDLIRHDQAKKAKAIQATFEKEHGDYPQPFYWRWKLSGTPPTDRPAAQRYILLCQSLSQRKKKLWISDLALCGEKEQVESALKEDSGD
jgi:tetratricopeptide (TPR) repeat protein